MDQPVDVAQAAPTPWVPPVGDNVRTNIDPKQPFLIPPWTTVDYFDKDGNKVGHFDQVRQYPKASDISNLDSAGAPYTAVLTTHEPVPGIVDTDYPEVTE